ncbi:protein shisa-4-like [Archocentrus centrarchus]|uniref:protein shisa-4-like n=1 Tax=Archocentrus centrarchus TaxID=63155 RepID=UPI0011E9E29E|nr:protein shisa-4-like [Archocentrus centrarchus]
MAPGLSSIVALVLYVILSPCVFAGDDCLPYDDKGLQKCNIGFCCGDCYSRYCCSFSWNKFDEDEQEKCNNYIYKYNFVHGTLPIVAGFVGFIAIVFIFICCCCCPCCCMYNMCRKPQSVIAAPIQTTVVTTIPQQCPEQPTAVPGPSQSYPGMPIQSVPAKPDYPAQPIYPAQPVYPAQPIYPAQPVYPAQPMPTSPYHVQPFTPGPPPSYQEATNPAYPPQPMPYSQAAFTSSQPTYPLKPPAEPQPNAPPASSDLQAQPPFNPDFVAPPP